MSSARGALGFLTIVGGSRRPIPAALGWFPVIGGLIGGFLGLLWVGADRLWPPLLAAVVVVVADLSITGMIHFDGLVDSADGLLPHLSRTRRLEVMSQPDVGAFGLGTGAAFLLARVAALSAISPNPLLLVALWCGSRSLMAGVANSVPYARDAGLARAFLGGRTLPYAVLGVCASAVVAWIAAGSLGGTALLLGGLAGVGVVGLARRRLGGFTGDVLGAAGLTAETFALMVAAARW